MFFRWLRSVVLSLFDLLAFLVRGEPESKPTTHPRRSPRSKDPITSYRSVASLLTPTERDYYLALRAAVGDRFTIFTKVRLADVLEPADKAHHQSLFNRIKSKHVDFVLCDSASFAPVLCIELDDASHRRKDRQKRDAFLDAAMHHAAVGLLRVTARSRYDSLDVLHQVDTAITQGS